MLKCEERDEIRLRLSLDLCDQIGESRVAKEKPASWCDAIRFILKLLWFHLAKISKSKEYI